MNYFYIWRSFIWCHVWFMHGASSYFSRV